MAEKTNKIYTKDLIPTIVERTGLTKAQVKKVFQSYKEVVAETLPTLEENGILELAGGLGSVQVKTAQEKTMFSKLVDKEITVPEHRKFKFRVSNKAKKSLN